ncbi:rab-GTPase-TBC domain-containing protein [Poronia punctata]|nr:rab-GTPase-TBC domain-containing protein [Poronia punctata]
MFGMADSSPQLAKSHSHSQSQPVASSLKSHGSVRHNKSKYRHTGLTPFRDDTRLVGLRYDQTVALEPPIPLPPPRSPLRPSPRPSPRPSSYVATHLPQSSHSQPSSHSPSTTTIAAPAVPPPRPSPPTQQHPALRTISSPRTFPFHRDTRRDSIHASTASSISYSHYGTDSSDEDEDPFAYERIDAVSAVRPLKLKAPSVGSSKYSLHDPGCISDQDQVRSRSQSRSQIPESIRNKVQTQHQNQQYPEGAAEARVSEAESRPSVVSSSPGLSEGGSTSSASPITPASPATPPPQFAKRFARSFSLRSGSFRSRSSSMKRLRKKSQSTDADTGGASGGGAGTGVGANVVLEPNNYTHSRTHSPASSIYSSPLSRPHSSRATNPIHASNYSANNNTPNSPSHLVHPVHHAGPSSPAISTTIPCESFFEEDDLTKLSFSIRGSLIFGGKRPWKKSGSISSGSHKMADEDVSPKHSSHTLHNNTNTSTKSRSFPLVPTGSKKDHANAAPARPPREDDMGVADIIQKPFQLPELPQHHKLVLPDSDFVTDDASTTPKLNPSIRVISAEAEKESQKVRSLYEPGEGPDRDVPLPLGGTHAPPPPEVPSGVDGNDAPAEQAPGPHTPMSATTSSPAPLDKPPGNSHELAGGVEDWDGVEGHDVDRYGFIVPQRPDTDSIASSSPVRFSPRKHRHVLFRKDASSLSSGVKRGRGPIKKMSARSLNTYTSELTSGSRRSVRSTIRQAANKLPHNRNRRLVDEAGDLLAFQPGLTHITEADGVEKMAAELKRKEATRSEKWRKMAKAVKPGSEGQGTIFHFDNKNPKLIERTWKGIPDCWRAAAWFSFLASSAKADPVNYVSDEDLKAIFQRLVEEPSPDDTQIDLDVPRTINQHIMFRRRYRGGQRLLFRVLHALSLHFPETGYVQGMAPLAATLLSYYDEEQCFIMLVRLWQFRGLNRIYQAGFVELMDALRDFETQWLTGKDVSDKLKELCIDPTAYATRWYLTLFNLSIPFSVQLRIWDVFMLLGSSPPDRTENGSQTGKDAENPSSKGLEILHATSLAIIDTLHATLIDSDFENAMKSLTSWIPIKDEQRFMEVVQIEWKRHQSKQRKKA